MGLDGIGYSGFDPLASAVDFFFDVLEETTESRKASRTTNKLELTEKIAQEELKKDPPNPPNSPAHESPSQSLQRRKNQPPRGYAHREQKGELDLAEWVSTLILEGIRYSLAELVSFLSRPEVRKYIMKEFGLEYIIEGTKLFVQKALRTVVREAGHLVKRVAPWLMKRLPKMVNFFLGILLEKVGEKVLEKAYAWFKGKSQNSNHSTVGSVLNDPSLTLEDKVALALALMAEKKMKEIEDKLSEWDQLYGGEGKSESSGFSITALAKKAGKALLEAVPGGNLVEYVFGGSTGSPENAPSEQKLQAELQLLVQKLQRLLETMSNIMKNFHDTSMNAIRNIR